MLAGSADSVAVFAREGLSDEESPERPATWRFGEKYGNRSMSLSPNCKTRSRQGTQGYRREDVAVRSWQLLAR
jgi:hypothetical protein